jgi:hypothetical protein
MKSWLSITLIVAGALFALGGGLLAYRFYHFNLGFTEITFWRDMIIFSFVAASGLAMLIAGIHKSLRSR